MLSFYFFSAFRASSDKKKRGGGEGGVRGVERGVINSIPLLGACI